MLGWISSAGSGRRTWMLWNGFSTAWSGQEGRVRHQKQKRRQKNNATLAADGTKEKANENQSDQHIRGRPGQSTALLYGSAGLCQENRLQSRSLSLADGGVA